MSKPSSPSSPPPVPEEEFVPPKLTTILSFDRRSGHDRRGFDRFIPKPAPLKATLDSADQAAQELSELVLVLARERPATVRHVRDYVRQLLRKGAYLLTFLA